MAPKDRFFIRIPANPSKGVKGGNIHVDPSTLDISILTELYTIEDTRGGTRYVPAHGFESTVTTGINPDQVVLHWQELMNQIETIVSPSGIAGVFGQELKGSLTDMTDFIRLLASGKTQEAKKALSAIGYGLAQAVGTATEALRILEERAASQGDLAEIMTGIVATSEQGGLYQGMAEKLAIKMDEALSALGELEDYESELDELYESLEIKARSWDVSSENPPEWLARPITWLGDEESGFCTRASRLLIESDLTLVPQMDLLVQEARGLIVEVTDQITRFTSEWTAAGESATKVLSGSSRADRLMRVVKEGRDVILEAQTASVDVFSMISGLITLQQQNCWNAYSESESWRSLYASGLRLRDKAESIRRLLDRSPSLSPSQSKVLERAQHYIELLEEFMSSPFYEKAETSLADTEPEFQAVTTQPIPQVPVVSRPDISSIPSPKLSSPDLGKITTNRLIEIYEMMLAIGEIKYCAPTYFIGGTPAAITALLVALGKMSEEERRLYLPALKELIARDTRVVTPSENRKQVWLDTRPDVAHWIRFTQNTGGTSSKVLWRLVEKARAIGQALCYKYELEPDEVQRVFAARKEEYRAKRSAKT